MVPNICIKHFIITCSFIFPRNLSVWQYSSELLMYNLHFGHFTLICVCSKIQTVPITIFSVRNVCTTCLSHTKRNRFVYVCWILTIYSYTLWRPLYPFVCLMQWTKIYISEIFSRSLYLSVFVPLWRYFQLSCGKFFDKLKLVSISLNLNYIWDTKAVFWMWMKCSYEENENEWKPENRWKSIHFIEH